MNPNLAHPDIRVVKAVDRRTSPDIQFDYGRAEHDLQTGLGILKTACEQILRNQQRMEARLRTLESRKG